MGVPRRSGGHPYFIIRAGRESASQGARYAGGAACRIWPPSDDLAALVCSTFWKTLGYSTIVLPSIWGKPVDKVRALKNHRRKEEPVAAPPDLDAVRAQLARARPLCRAWAETVPEDERTAQAALFARQALEVFARAVDPALALSPSPVPPTGCLDNAAAMVADSMGGDAAKLPLAEGLHIITSLYPSLMPEQQRGLLGAYYTPPALTGRLLDQATEAGVDWRSARVLDPAVGGGAFLVEAALRMRATAADCRPEFALAQIASRLVGFELDPHAAGLAQNALEIVFADLARAASRPIPSMVKVCDTLEEDATPTYDVVLGNPPYGRVPLTAAQRQRYKRSLFGHANLYGVFTDAALRWTKPGGLIAYLTPTSFLAGQYYSSLRSLLAQEAPPVAIDFVHARRGVFEDVLQETMIAVYRRGGKPVRAQIHYLTVADERQATITRNGTVGLPKTPAAPWLAPRQPEHSALIRHAEVMTTRLSSWGYSVSTGPLVWNRFKGQLTAKSGGKNVYPLVWAESVGAEGQFVFKAEKKNHLPYFKVKNPDGWLLTRDSCVLVQRTTAKEQARRLIAAELPAEFIAEHGGVVVENHLNMVRAKGKPKVPPAVVAALLNSRALDQVFRCMNGSVAVSAFELEALPLPTVAALKTLKRLVEAKAGADRVEAECDRLYGLKS